MIPRGKKCSTRQQFADTLREWYDSTDERTIGDVGRFGGKAWMHVGVMGHACHLNADTTRDGVREFLDLVRREGAGMDWVVVRNSRNDRFNKICFGLGEREIPGFYCYLDSPLAAREVF